MKSALIQAVSGTAWSLSRVLTGGRLTVLTYHGITELYDPLANADQITALTFKEHMELVSRYCHVLALPDAVERLRSGTLPANALAITFDDGYLNNYEVALPILQSLGLTATFFITTGYLNGGLMFNDILTEAIRRTRQDQIHVPPTVVETGVLRLDSAPARTRAAEALIRYAKYLPEQDRPAFCDEIWNTLVPAAGMPRPRLIMSAEHVRKLHQAGMTIGGHSHTHPILTCCSIDKAREEIQVNRDVLQNITGEWPVVFAYPNGRANKDYDLRHTAILADAGYRCAVTTERGVCCPEMDLFQLPRFMPWAMNQGKLLYHLTNNAIRGTHPIVARG